MNTEARIRVRFDRLREASDWVGLCYEWIAFEESAPYLTTAMEILSASGDPSSASIIASLQAIQDPAQGRELDGSGDEHVLAAATLMALFHSLPLSPNAEARSGLLDRAIADLKQLHPKLPKKRPEVGAAFSFRIGQALTELGRCREAVPFLARAERAFKKLGEAESGLCDEVIGDILYYKALCYHDLARPSNAFRTIEECEALNRALLIKHPGGALLLCRTLGTKGRWQLEVNNFQEGLETLTESLALLENDCTDGRRFRLIREQLMHLAVAKLAFGQLDAATEHFSKSTYVFLEGPDYGLDREAEYKKAAGEFYHALEVSGQAQALMERLEKDKKQGAAISTVISESAANAVSLDSENPSRPDDTIEQFRDSLIKTGEVLREQKIEGKIDIELLGNFAGQTLSLAYLCMHSGQTCNAQEWIEYGDDISREVCPENLYFSLHIQLMTLLAEVKMLSGELEFAESLISRVCHATDQIFNPEDNLSQVLYLQSLLVSGKIVLGAKFPYDADRNLASAWLTAKRLLKGGKSMPPDLMAELCLVRASANFYASDSSVATEWLDESREYLSKLPQNDLRAANLTLEAAILAEEIAVEEGRLSGAGRRLQAILSSGFRFDSPYGDNNRLRVMRLLAEVHQELGLNQESHYWREQATALLGTQDASDSFNKRVQRAHALASLSYSALKTNNMYLAELAGCDSMIIYEGLKDSSETYYLADAAADRAAVASVFTESGDHESSMITLREALRNLQNASFLTSKEEIALARNAKNLLARNLLATGRPDEAIGLLRELVEDLEESEDFRSSLSMATTYSNLATVLRGSNYNEESVGFFLKALETVPASSVAEPGSNLDLFTTIRAISCSLYFERIFLAKKDLNKAISRLNSSLSVLEAIRLRTSSVFDREIFSECLTDTQKSLAGLLIESARSSAPSRRRQKLFDAMRVLELGRSRRLTDLFVGRSADAQTDEEIAFQKARRAWIASRRHLLDLLGLGAPLLQTHGDTPERFDDSRDSEFRLRIGRVHGMDVSGSESKDVQAARQEEQVARARLTDADATASASKPRFRREVTPKKAFSPDLSSIIDDETALLSIATGPFALLAILASKQGCFESTIPFDEAQALLNACFEKINSVVEWDGQSDTRPLVESATAELINSLKQITDQLLLPLFANVSSSLQKIVLSIDEWLSPLPFHAVSLGGRGRSLSEVYEICTVPAFSFYSTSVAPISPDRVVVISDPNDNLVSARVEGLACWQNSKATRISGSDATVEAMVREAREAQILHFTGHANFNTLDRLESGLELRDEVLSVHRLLDEVDLSRCRLAILNGCQTSFAPRQRFTSEGAHIDLSSNHCGMALEQLSISTAVLCAGARSSVGTLWPVPDLPSALLLWRFSILIEASPQEWEPSRTLVGAIKWLREEVSDGDFLLKSVIPAFLTNIPEIHVTDIVRLASNYARSHPTTPPFAHPLYWAGYVIQGCGWS